MRGEYEHTVESHGARCGRRHARVVRLRSAARNYDVGFLRDRVGHQELELARLVAAEGESGEVVAFDEDARTTRGAAQRSAQTLRFHDWRWKHRKRDAILRLERHRRKVRRVLCDRLLQHSPRGDEIRPEPITAGIEVGVADASNRARGVDDVTIPHVDRDVRDRLAWLGEEHQVAGSQRAEVGGDAAPHARLIARDTREGDAILCEYVFREARAVEPLTRCVATPDVPRADVRIRSAKHSSGSSGRGRRIWNPSSTRTRSAAGRRGGRRKVRDDGREDYFGRYAERRRRAAGEAKKRCSGDRADPYERWRDHVASQGILGASVSPNAKGLRANALAMCSH